MTDGKWVHVEDHAEWAAIAAGSDTGAYRVEGFVVRDATTEELVTEPDVVERAVEELAQSKGWDLRLAVVRGQLMTSRFGCWWVSVPVDYLDGLDDRPAMTFDVELGDRSVSLWAYEHYAEVEEPERVIPEFEHIVEMGVNGGTMYVYEEKR